MCIGSASCGNEICNLLPKRNISCSWRLSFQPEGLGWNESYYMFEMGRYNCNLLRKEIFKKII